MRLLRHILLAGSCAILMNAPAVCAQQQTQDQGAPPIPAYHSPLAGIGDNGASDADNNSGQTAIENQPLSGVQNLSLGLEANRSYWQPHFDFSGTADSNALETHNGFGWETWISGSGGVDLHRVTGISNLSLSYVAGGMYSNSNTIGSGITQQLGFTDRLSFRRSSLSLLEQASYLPESSSGFGGLGGNTLPGSGSAGLAFNAGQSVLTGRGQNLNDTSAVELDELLSSRTSLTFSGGYSLLHYFDSNLFNYGVVNARGGYNYQVTRKDTLAAIYTFGDYRYANSGQTFTDHTMQVSYGRVITGKLAFQIAAGPQIVFSQGVVTGTGTSSMTQVLWTLNSSLQYQQRRYGLGLSYNRGVSGGSGVLVGSRTDNVTGTVTRQMSRTFSSGFSGGFSRNQGLSNAGAAAGQLYDYWYGAITLTKPIGPSLGLNLSYQVQYQTSNSALCVGPTCGANVLRHMISVGLGWHERPLLF